MSLIFFYLSKVPFVRVFQVLYKLKLNPSNTLYANFWSIKNDKIHWYIFEKYLKTDIFVDNSITNFYDYYNNLHWIMGTIENP